MTAKIKEFKGSLHPIFQEGNLLSASSETTIKEIETLTRELPIFQISPNQNQPRKIFAEVALQELAQSIKSKGVIQPIIVRAYDEGVYEIIVGERRWRAAQMAGLVTIPAIIRQYDHTEAKAVALIENIQRENLNPLEEAEAIQSLLEDCALTHLEVAESIGRSRASVSNLIRLLTLNDAIKTMIHANLLEMGHARALVSLTTDEQIEVANLIVSKKLSVRETEKIVQNLHQQKDKPFIQIDPIIKNKAENWKNLLSKQLSSKVNVHFNAEGKGKIVINFNSMEDADWLMNHIVFTETEIIS